MLTANLTTNTASSDRRCLLPDELYAIDGARVAGIRVEHGEVWVSFDGEDLIYVAGDDALIDTQDRIVLQALGVKGAEIVLDVRVALSDTEADGIDNALPGRKL